MTASEQVEFGNGGSKSGEDRVELGDRGSESHRAWATEIEEWAGMGKRRRSVSAKDSVDLVEDRGAMSGLVVQEL